MYYSVLVILETCVTGKRTSLAFVILFSDLYLEDVMIQVFRDMHCVDW